MMNDQTEGEKGKGASGNILLIDDDKFLVDMYSMKFAGAGFNVQACLSVADALRFLRDGFAAEAIVFDIVMPEHDGFSFLQTLDAEHLAPDAVKIALTNQGNDAEKAKAEGLGVDRYVVKASMIPSEVVEAVKEEVKKHGKKK
ncbi:DNA-binding response regulator [Candidatus Parcubacteria bacterium]|nr:MAG: DNA-binding response regulator [Candidatus Parcubacteria bacterium]